MFDLINGLPVHPLVVHGVAVLLPLAIIGALAVAISPRLRQRYGSLVLGIAVIATLLIPVATQSGEALERHFSPGDRPDAHAALGEQLIYFALPFVVLLAALLWFDRAAKRATPDTSKAGTSTPHRTLLLVLALLTGISGLATGYQVFRVGESGAKAVWSDQVTKTYPSHDSSTK